MNDSLPSPSRFQSSNQGRKYALPTGTVTFLFTDIEGSTTLWESRPEQMAEALQLHNTVLQQAIEDHKGVVFKIIGDAFQAAFATALQALKAAIDGQKALQTANILKETSVTDNHWSVRSSTDAVNAPKAQTK